MDHDQSLREHVVYLLQGGGAHLDFEQAVAGIDPQLWGARVNGISHTLWGLMEHLRICQWDILEFSRNPNHLSPEFPQGYWPETDAPPNDLVWDRSVQRFRDDLNAMIELVTNQKNDLFEKIPHGDGQTLLREALLVADHNAYHFGQIVYLRKALHNWDD